MMSLGLCYQVDSLFELLKELIQDSEGVPSMDDVSTNDRSSLFSEHVESMCKVPFIAYSIRSTCCCWSLSLHSKLS